MRLWNTLFGCKGWTDESVWTNQKVKGHGNT